LYTSQDIDINADNFRKLRRQSNCALSRNLVYI